MAKLPFPLLNLSTTKLLQLLMFSLLALTVALHTFLPYFTSHLLHLLSHHKLPFLALSWCVAISIFAYLSTRPRPTLLLDFSCFLPPPDRRCSYEVCEYFLRRSPRQFTPKSEQFMQGIYHKSGLGDETYAPPFIFDPGYDPTLSSAIQEAQEGMFSAVDSVLNKTAVDPSAIDTVIVTCGSFSPSPSLTSLLVNRYGFHPSVKTYNLSGMGCGSGVMSIDLASKVLAATPRRVRYALVVVTESISLNWYFGEERSMLVTNCIFRVGCAAAVLTNDPSRRRSAKMELQRTLRTNRGADDASYTAAFQMEDEKGNPGIALKKDLIRVAGEALKEHIRTLAPRVLPLSQLLLYASRWWASRGEDGAKAYVPDFTTAFDHLCVHTGGKAVIESVARVLRLNEEVTEPARMTLHRFGNTSSSLVFYELAYYEAKGRVKAGDRMWMLAFGTGFKVCSLVWKALRDCTGDCDNPWKGSIHRYPLKAW